MNRDTDIAVVGAGCRFPDASTPQEFWRNLDAGTVSVRELSDEDLLAAGVEPGTWADPAYVRKAARLDAPADFAGEFFGYSRAEAEAVDPQQRLFLEVCWEALESAGHGARAGSATGVFAGSHAGPYSARLLAATALRDGWPAALGDVALHLGGLGDFLPARVAYKLGLRGPTAGVQAACASALYSVHQAVLSLLAGECDLALAGGATVLEPETGYRQRPDGSLSADGYCRSYDAASTGTFYSSGVAAVALRRLPDALADGDPVLAVLRGTAVGNHGADRAGFTAPSAAGIADVVGRALEAAGVRGDQLDYVEGHGVGTPIGDRLEIRGLTAGLGPGVPAGRIALGSVKANIGHTGPASGLAGLLSAVHVVRTGRLVPHPLFAAPREPGAFAKSPFHVTTEPRALAGAERFALVNNIGFGGNNAVAVVAAPPAPVRAPAPERPVVRLTLSARNDVELDALAGRLAEAVESGDVPLSDVSTGNVSTGGTPMGDLAHTLRVGRRAFPARRVVTVPAGNPADGPVGLARLAAALRDPVDPAVRSRRAASGQRLAVVVPPGTPGADELLGLLAAAFPRRSALYDAVADVPGKAFTVLVGDGMDAGAHTGPVAHLPARPADAAGAVEELAHEAWLHGVDVDWAALAGSRGRRVPLPTYPFPRERYWALDHFAGQAAAPLPPGDRSRPHPAQGDPA
ncbi:beta-ketoacyl synthase N-terminal-like domain-containing protein [Streptomyces sp. URMC 124]|uniref:beta-ketoacyl [acyl carrier protein] synthase domain-containing protein n=1 Tax=Streptomyces sp. URMC 124 TaxID=3423405 RepID=UPI003F1B18FF